VVYGKGFMDAAYLVAGWKRVNLTMVDGRFMKSGVVSALKQGITALQKAIREQVVILITAFCMVHSRSDRKAVKCRP
jgi:hypothetical protein